jgi:signal recognition particle subunit SRP54
LKKRSLEESPPKGLSRKDHIVSILYDELSRLMGNKGDITPQNKQPEKQIISFSPGKLNVVLMFGIQGSGKTTVTAKLARWLTKHGYHVGVIGADTWRPGALTQLKMNCVKINVDVFGDESTKDATLIVKNGISYFGNARADVVQLILLADTKMKQNFRRNENMYDISKPDLILLVT